MRPKFNTIFTVILILGIILTMLISCTEPQPDPPSFMEQLGKEVKSLQGEFEEGYNADSIKVKSTSLMKELGTGFKNLKTDFEKGYTDSLSN